MFCQNCGSEIEEGTNFCHACGKKINSDGAHESYDVVETQSQNPVTAIKVDTIPQLKDQLIAMREAKDNDSALTYAVEAQLQVLDVLNSPAMTSSCFDLMIESLHKALQRTPDEQQKKELQERAAIMTQNIIFFMEAKLRYEEDKHSEQAKTLMKKGCSLLAESASGIMTGGISGGVKVMGGKLYENMMQDDGFFSMLFDFVTKKQRLEKNNMEFNAFIIDFFGKLDRYRTIFGKSILLSELVHRYKDRLIGQHSVHDPDEPYGFLYKPGMWIKSLLFILVLTGFSIIPVKLELFSMDTWSNIVPLAAIGLWLGINVLYLISCIIGSIREKIAYNKALKAFDKHNEILENYFTSIADDYNVISSSGAEQQRYTLKELKPLNTVLLNYERLHDRIEKKREGKSWVTCVFLCIFLGWMGAHRFYVGKIGTGILMLCLIPSGISVIWAIIDLIMIFSGKFSDNMENKIRPFK